MLDAPLEKAAETKAVGGAVLELVRFTREELGIRPVALAGTYGEVGTDSLIRPGLEVFHTPCQSTIY